MNRDSSCTTLSRQHSITPPLSHQVKFAENDPVDCGVSMIEEEEGARYAFGLSAVQYIGETEYQSVIIGDSLAFGRVLTLDGAIQSAELDEGLYHEMLVQPAMLVHDSPKNVLIIGGGEGATLREVLAHKSVKSVTMVDLDKELVELCKEHLHSWHRGAFDDPRVNMVFTDGRAFVENSKELFDVIIIDIVDMLDNGPAQALYTTQFYEKLSRRLTPKGLLVIQAMELSVIDYGYHAALRRTVSTVFPEVHTYLTMIPSFLSAWGFLIASNWFSPKTVTGSQLDESIDQKLGKDWLRFIDGEFILSQFVLSKRMRALLEQPGPVLCDGVDFTEPPALENVVPATTKFPALKAQS